MLPAPSCAGGKCHRGDLDRAGNPLADDQVRTGGPHALRTAFGFWLGLYLVDPRAQIAVSRHAPQGVTLKNHQDFGQFDMRAEIGTLLPIPTAAEAVEMAQATGKDDGQALTGGKVGAPRCNSHWPQGSKPGRWWPES